jgi:catechol 2,3-dioxygenase-like lactoylglutathione lyase family enzyme
MGGDMPFHHLGLATRDLGATHLFYTEAVGFELGRVDVIRLANGSWFRHVMYDTGDDQLLTFFELHDDDVTEYRTDISTGLGLPGWVNHIAFSANDLDDLERHKQRLLEHGHDCVVADHGSGFALYVEDPNGNTIEFFCELEPTLSEASRRDAARRLMEAEPEGNVPEPVMEFFTSQSEAVPAL